MSKAGEAPIPYQKILYLESVGAQYVEIPDVTYSASNDYLIKCRLISTDATQSSVLNGWDAGGAFGFRYNGYNNGDGTIFGTGSSNSISNVSLLINKLSNTLTTMTVNVGGAVYERSRSHGSLATYASNKGYHLFACWSQTSVKYFCKERIYYCKIYVNNSLVKDLVPVRIENDGFLYDKISGSLYQNLGSGAFILGNDVN